MKPAAPIPAATIPGRLLARSLMASAIVSSVAFGSCAGVSRLSETKIRPASSTTPAATFVPPMSTPIVSAMKSSALVTGYIDSRRPVGSAGRTVSGCRVLAEAAAACRAFEEGVGGRGQGQRSDGEVRSHLRIGVSDAPNQQADRAELALLGLSGDMVTDPGRQRCNQLGGLLGCGPHSFPG